MKKYTRASQSAGSNLSSPGVILLLGHAVGFCKEIWEPTIHEIYKLDAKKSTGPIIREVWGLDYQNHGEAAILNEDVLFRNKGIFTIWDYADAFATLVRSGLLGTVHNSMHEIVLCGHSAGAGSVVLSTSYFNPPSRIPFSKIILVDPSISSKQLKGHESELFTTMEAKTPIRRDIWENFDDASKWLKKRQPWKSWDDRVFDVYIKNGLRALPTAFYPTETGVTLSAHRLDEYAALARKQYFNEAVDRLNQICTHVPVHLVFGDKNDIFDKEFQNSLLNEQEGRVYASETRMENVGHHIPQQAPTELASVIMEVLATPSNAVRNKL